MIAFGSSFFICNLIITIFISLILCIKHLFRHYLSGRMRYHFGFSILALLYVPFLPFRPVSASQFISLLDTWNRTVRQAAPVTDSAGTVKIQHTAAGWINDFSVSVSRETSSGFYLLFLVIWVLGMLVMIVFAVISRLRLYRLEQSALPLQNRAVIQLFAECAKELHIKRTIPVYSTAFCKSPFTIGFLSPRIYIPIHLISEFDPGNMRYMLLHELQHYKHKDAIVNTLMNLTQIVYWFHPLVWFVFKEMRSEREIACDSYVLQILDEKDYMDYGNTLILFAEKISLSPFPFTAGMGGNIHQIKKRILNIASYQKETKWMRRKGFCILLLTSIVVLETATLLPVHAVSYTGNATTLPKDTDQLDLADYFQGYEGCFVLSDLNTDTWQVYNETLAVERVSPNSTYKIYSALAGLESGVLTPDETFMKWDGQHFPFAEWNQDQTLSSAMLNSVNWYFQSIDQQVGLSALEQFYRDIGYGNHDLSGGLSDYWRESSLQISATEQVALLKDFYTNKTGVQYTSVQAVKNALKISSWKQGILYGKTGTGAVDNENVNGWFIGFLEVNDNTYFFATNIRGDSDASGSMAAAITADILQYL